MLKLKRKTMKKDLPYVLDHFAQNLESELFLFSLTGNRIIYLLRSSKEQLFMSEIFGDVRYLKSFQSSFCFSVLLLGALIVNVATENKSTDAKPILQYGYESILTFPTSIILTFQLCLDHSVYGTICSQVLFEYVLSLSNDNRGQILSQQAEQEPKTSRRDHAPP